MKKITCILAAAALLSACAKDKSDYNIDIKNPQVATAPPLFTAAAKSFSDIITSPSVNNNPFRFYAQYWTSTEYLDEPRYNLLARPIPQAFWQALYRDVLMDLREARKLITADQFMAAPTKASQLAQTEIMEVMAWSTLVNTYGNIPYSEALDVTKTQPKYDDAATIYADLLTRLDAALTTLNSGATGYGAADVFYNGDIAKWRKFGNSLKLRLGLILADKDPAKAKTLIEAAAPNVMTSAADNLTFRYMKTTPNNNPIANATNPGLTTRKDYVGAKPFIDKLNSLQDPRRAGFFTTVGGNFVGGYYGFSNSYSNFSTLNPKIAAYDFEALLLDYTEVEFALAEAAARGFTVPGTAETHYNNAITSSILYWGGTTAQAATYLARPDVAWSSASANYREKIGLQKWIALYNRGYDAWVEWKRLDYPVLAPPSPATAPPGETISPGLVIPVRLIYPINEQTLNTANRAAAASAIGGDLITSKIFWDVN
ncbi:SusD/RagB family nutrient-binding outer membrane lipoprotein [Pedobacter yulinensis]|uniref:SusD/RagB family nutrient-binding outer membrane lipoprotein n=1 Tax=Pedobacter yulinensis TaxID=2126353 RepID=A0A2T3HLT0_9SPHI|nr:SusD/RagB family nutrient-binding outer membrane lipoprotein [Pedobacter yulinensis]PST83395.1 SusD/RagB family nutrient-binding outer membrane lipoprotein [Pedobacter yulinensis]